MKKKINIRNIKYLQSVDYNEYTFSYFKMPNGKWYLVSENHQLGKIDNIERISVKDINFYVIRAMGDGGFEYIFGPKEGRKYMNTHLKKGEEKIFYDTKVGVYAKHYFHGRGSLSVRADREVREFKKINKKMKTERELSDDQWYT